jgi:hypothetical protein
LRACRRVARPRLNLLPVDITVINGFGGDPVGLDMFLTDHVPNLVSRTVANGITTYVYNGTSNGSPKLWTVQSANDAQSFGNALRFVPYVAYGGHANMGLGPAVQATPSSPAFNPANITGVNGFFGVCNPQAAINFALLQSEGYTSFAFPSNIPPTVANYPVPNFGLVRYPNDNDISESGTFTVMGTGTNKYHMTRKAESGAEQKFVVVNTAGKQNLPVLGYKIFFDCQCSSARDYSEVFPYGTFIGLNDWTSASSVELGTFVVDVMNGKGANDITTDLNGGSDQKVYVYKTY